MIPALIAITRFMALQYLHTLVICFTPTNATRTQRVFLLRLPHVIDVTLSLRCVTLIMPG